MVAREGSCGFTVVELLAVVSIMGVFAAVVLVSLHNARIKARDAKRVSDVRQIMTALELFFNSNNRYPPGAADRPVLTEGSPALSTFLQAYPSYPAPANDGGCGAAQYAYVQGTAGGSYTLTFCLGRGTGSLEAGHHTASQDGIQ